MALLTIFLVLYVIIAISLILGLLVNGVRPSKTLAWLLAIFTIPVGGILLYLLLGRNRRKNKILKKKDVSFKGASKTWGGITQKDNLKHRRIINLVGKNCGFFPLEDNKAILLKDGKTTFQSIFNALENAKSYIYLQYYIFEEGDLADRLLQLFQSKVKQGLKVRMIYDSIGSYTLSKKYIKGLKSAGVEVFPFLPFRFDRFLSALNYRNHRKIIIVDGIHGFTGGINISDKYLKGDPDLGIWHDMHLQITGPAVSQLEEVFLSDWFLVSEEQLQLNDVKEFNLADSEDFVPIQIVSSGPEDDFANIQQTYFSMITSAKKYLYITNPYVMPGPEILHALQTASLSGVDVRLLVSERGDSTIVDWSIRSYFEPLLRAGVRLFLFPDGFLHSKIIVSDDSLATVGTANIDMRSFEHNYEVNALVYDEGFAEKLKRDFLKDCLNSIELDYDQFKQRTWITKLKEGTAKIFSPIL
ncbi:cardiolipin synthase [Flagellimonas allohymeniacidonis]|uniref:Cardiolipin synthase n=1 Tax=Flagellimonas allohymeniacidonis TaxID=2517819 RepID=A0A4Q8QGS1_9FLAO|nr:cardiolipin synthase [Allomuricauda hymeniacidonis]TAI49755.1 cardiolipin synthase [Allomuricauda hymeniacidonis]